MSAKRKPQRWIMLADGVFQGRATSAGELMQRRVSGSRVRIVNEDNGDTYHRSVDRRLKVKWRREKGTGPAPVAPIEPGGAGP